MEELARADLAGSLRVIPVVSEHRLADPDSAGLRPLFAAALESGRSRGELLSTLLSASLSLAGADLAVVCGPEGTLLASAREPGCDADPGSSPPGRCARWSSPASPTKGSTWSSWRSARPAYLAVRWARARLGPARRGPGHRRRLRAAAGLGRAGPAGGPARTAARRRCANWATRWRWPGGPAPGSGCWRSGSKRSAAARRADEASAAAVAGLQGALRRGDVLVRVDDEELVAILGVVRDESELVEAATRFVERAGRPHDPAGAGRAQHRHRRLARGRHDRRGAAAPCRPGPRGRRSSTATRSAGTATGSGAS